MTNIKEGKTYSFRNMPPDVYKIILKAQNRMKEQRGTSQFSLELTIYHIIREFEKCREEKEVKK